MFSESQRLYIEEVLGTTVAGYRTHPIEAPSVVVSTIVVLTPPLQSEGRALLAKILASIKLNEFVHVEGTEAGEAAHVLHFAEGAKPGRSETALGTYWGFHDLNRLLGEGREVTIFKREVWTLLQAFAREIPCF